MLKTLSNLVATFLIVTVSMASLVISTVPSVEGQVGTPIQVPVIRDETEDSVIDTWIILKDGMTVQDKNILALLRGPTKPGAYSVIKYPASGIPEKYTLSFSSDKQPIPDVNPVDPKPVDPPDISKEPLKVLIVRDAKALNLPHEQQLIFISNKISSYLSKHCSLSKDNKPDYRIWDDSYTQDQLKNEDPLWSTLYTRPRTSLPWIVIVKGTKAVEGPLPNTVDETLSLLETWGGK